MFEISKYKPIFNDSKFAFLGFNKLKYHSSRKLCAKIETKNETAVVEKKDKNRKVYRLTNKQTDKGIDVGQKSKKKINDKPMSSSTMQSFKDFDKNLIPYTFYIL